MSYNMELSNILLGDLELFPEGVLSSALCEDKPEDTFIDHSLSRGPHSDTTPDLNNDLFPDWLDLKIDLFPLEGLETPDSVLDDLLLGEINVGPSTNVPQAFQLEADAISPLHMKHVLSEQNSGTVKLYSEASSLHSELDGPAASPYPSSPDCHVPEMNTSDKHLCSLTPRLERPNSTLPLGTSSPETPTPAETSFLSFVAPVVQPISTVNIVLGLGPLPLDALHFSFVSCDESSRTQMLSDHALLCSPAEVRPKPTRNYKRRSKTNPESSANVKKLKLLCESDPPSTPTSKKERKRKQNKDAAIRYRLKKRMETDTVAVEVGQLLEENRKLKEKAQHLATELGYLKNLMKDMFKAKGLLKVDS